MTIGLQYNFVTIIGNNLVSKMAIQAWENPQYHRFKSDFLEKQPLSSNTTFHELFLQCWHRVWNKNH